MKHILPRLNFAPGDLAPFLTAETFEFHHGKHHNAYVDKLNGMIDGTEFKDASLTEIVKNAEGGLFNNAAQHYNHSFYWCCIAPGTAGPNGALATAIDRDFDSLDSLQIAFTQAAATHFGSGWAWLVKDAQGKLQLRITSDAGCPLTSGDAPLLTCDVWEHAYYIDYRNARPKYIEAFWKSINWDFVALALESPDSIEDEILGTVSA